MDQSPLIEHRKLIANIERRAFLRGTASLGALTLLTGCDISNESALQGVLRAMSGWNDRVQAFLFDPHRARAHLFGRGCDDAAALQRLLFHQ